MTSAASKRSVLSCRWSFMQQRSRKKRSIFYCPHGQYLGDELDGIWFPSACFLLLLPSLVCSREKPTIFNLLCLYWGKFPSFFTSARIFLCGPVLHRRPPDRLRRATTSHCARGAVKCLVALATTPGVPLTFAVLREACVESRTGGTVSGFELCVCAR